MIPPAPADLEAQIASKAALLARAETPDVRAAAWAELQRLHGLRSAEMVERMERERGLR